ncbi:MAG: hypothetical protein Q8936_20945, partial [Bacillota bacterium]|nr:hypothetical protein [Bacillota bacterium]
AKDCLNILKIYCVKLDTCFYLNWILYPHGDIISTIGNLKLKIAYLKLLLIIPNMEVVIMFIIMKIYTCGIHIIETGAIIGVKL